MTEQAEHFNDAKLQSNLPFPAAATATALAARALKTASLLDPQSKPCFEPTWLAALPRLTTQPSGNEPTHHPTTIE